MCSKQQVSEKAKEVEEKLPLPKHQQARWESNPDNFFVDCFWGRRSDGVCMAIDIKKKGVFVLEFKRSTDRVEGFLETKGAAANEHHSSFIEVLRAVVKGWVVEQINFVAGNRRSVMESDFYEKLEKLDVQAGNKDKIFSHHLHRCVKHTVK